MTSVRDSQAYKLACKHLAGLQANGPVSLRDLVTWYDFHEYLVNLLEEQQLRYRGHSVLDKGWATLLVMKVVKDGTPVVGFFTEKDTTGCMRVFLRRLSNKTVVWKEDKFA